MSEPIPTYLFVLPCPWCAKTAHLALVTPEPTIGVDGAAVMGGPPMRAVSCTGCGIVGPWRCYKGDGDMRERAIAAWNTRP